MFNYVESMGENMNRKKFLILCCMLIVGLSGCDKKNESIPTTTEAEVTTTQAEAEQSKSTETDTNDITVSVESTNSWESNGMICAQFDGKITNQSDSNKNGWEVKLSVPEGAKLENGWNGVYSIEENTLIIKPEDYNAEIVAGGEITFGFILDTKESFSPSDIVLTIAGMQYAAGNEVKEEEKASTTEAAKNDKKKETVSEGNPFKAHGALSVKGTDLVDKDGNVFQLKGVSTHGINWFPDYVNEAAFSDLHSYGVNAIRLAMYTADYNGYCSGGNKEELTAIVDKGVEICNKLGLYVIIDWHILNDTNPLENKDSAKTFFEEVSKKYSKYDNVIYEICNEPNSGTSWKDIKTYSEEVIPIIRKNAKNAIIIVGTPNWSQDVDIASKDPITGFDNIMYAVHFYASTHKESIRNKVKTARENGLPVIVSECSICEASGNGSINYDEAKSWIDYINDNQMSYFAWNLSNKDEQSSLIKASVTKTEGFVKEDFSETGLWFIEQFQK